MVSIKRIAQRANLVFCLQVTSYYWEEKKSKAIEALKGKWERAREHRRRRRRRRRRPSYLCSSPLLLLGSLAAVSPAPADTLRLRLPLDCWLVWLTGWLGCALAAFRREWELARAFVCLCVCLCVRVELFFTFGLKVLCSFVCLCVCVCVNFCVPGLKMSVWATAQTKKAHSG